VSGTECAVLLLLATSLIWTILSQMPEGSLGALDRLVDRAAAVDLFGLTPYWFFFAPLPGTADFYLLYRDRLPDGLVTPWKAIPNPMPTGPLACLWQPDRLAAKAMADLGTEISTASSGPAGSRRLSVEYVAALNHVLSQPHAPGAAATQFLVMSARGHPPERQFQWEFSSGFHTLTP
jgi:hypothetical protein